MLVKSQQVPTHDRIVNIDAYSVHSCVDAADADERRDDREHLLNRRVLGDRRNAHQIDDHAIAFRAWTVPPGANDVNCYWEGSGSILGGDPACTIAGIAGWWDGLWGIERQDSMWRDESVTYQVAHRPLGELWGLLGHIDAVHGLYYLLMHTVFALWDGGLVALRLPSVLATAALVLWIEG